MRLKKFLNELKVMEKTLIAFAVDNRKFKDLQSQIENLLKEYNINYKILTDNPHISVAQIVGKHPKDEIIRAMHKINLVKFKPKELIKIYGSYTKKDYITIGYRANQVYQELFNKMREQFIVKLFPDGMKPHISLFSLVPNVLSNEIFQEIVKKIGKSLPIIKPKDIVLFNKMHNVEFSRRVK